MADRRHWKTQFENNGRIRSIHGDREHKLYGAVYDESGRIRLEEKGTESLYDYIQSFADSVDIHVILKRFANGETDVLNRVQGFYGDFTNLPANYAQMLNTVQAGEDMFNKMPVEVRAKFGHSFNEFMTCLCDGSLYDRLGISPPAEPDPSPSEPTPAPDVPPAE